MGLAGVRLFAQEGARVVATDISTEALEREVAAIAADGGDVLAVTQDVGSEGAWEEVIGRTLERYERVDVLVNNAGIHLAKGILETSLEEWDRVMRINTTRVWLGMRAVIPPMRDAGGGSIVNVSSIAGIVGGAGDGHGAAYSASKGGVRSLTKHVAQWFAADNIRVNSIHPGAVFTGMAAQGGYTRESMAESLGSMIPLPPHVGDPEDIGYGMVYLASDEAKYVTGEELVIDGGWITH